MFSSTLQNNDEQKHMIKGKNMQEKVWACLRLGVSYWPSSNSHISHKLIIIMMYELWIQNEWQWGYKSYNLIMTFKGNYFILEERSPCTLQGLLWEIEAGICFFLKKFFAFQKSYGCKHSSHLHCNWHKSHEKATIQVYPHHTL